MVQVPFLENLTQWSASIASLSRHVIFGSQFKHRHPEQNDASNTHLGKRKPQRSVLLRLTPTIAPWSIEATSRGSDVSGSPSPTFGAPSTVCGEGCHPILGAE